MCTLEDEVSESAVDGWKRVRSKIRTKQGAKGFGSILDYLSRFGDMNPSLEQILVLDLETGHHTIQITVTDIYWSGISNFVITGKVLQTNGKVSPVSKGDIVRLAGFKPAQKSAEALEVYDS